MYSTFITNKLLSELSTFGIGGPARYFVEVKEISHMQQLIAFCTEEGLEYFVLGKGSNCLFDSKGLNRLVIHNKIDFCTELEPGSFHVGAGYSFSLLGMQTAKKGWSGLEFASGIPASVGGAVFMNAGAQKQSTFDTLVWVEAVIADGSLVRFSKDEIAHAYRYSAFQDMKAVIVSGLFSLTQSSEARTRQLDLLSTRIRSQPYQDKSAGCVFKNPTCTSAGALIDACNLKGFSIGGAAVSQIHANFLINQSGASSEDVLALIDHVQKRVKETHAVELKREIFWVSDQ